MFQGASVLGILRLSRGTARKNLVVIILVFQTLSQGVGFSLKQAYVVSGYDEDGGLIERIKSVKVPQHVPHVGNDHSPNTLHVPETRHIQQAVATLDCKETCMRNIKVSEL